jgi:hypothetical protein
VSALLGTEGTLHRLMPNFLIIGAMRSGTTALYSFLEEHPGAFVSATKDQVEGSPSVTTLEAYLQLFSGATDGLAIGEASHSYLYYPGAIERIKACLGNVKLVCILRDPASRAFSHFMFHVGHGREETGDFGRALDLEEERVREGMHFGHYVRRGLYAAQVRRVFEVFPREAVRVYLYEDLASRPVWLAQDMYRFLGVGSGFQPDTSMRRNPSGVPRSEILHRILVRRNPLKRSLQPVLPKGLYKAAAWMRDWNLVKPDLDPAIRGRLAERFQNDILETGVLIGRDLSAWLV